MTKNISWRRHALLLTAISTVSLACGSSGSGKSGTAGAGGADAAASSSDTAGAGGSAGASAAAGATGTAGAGAGAAGTGTAGASIGAGGMAMTVVDAGAPDAACPKALEILFSTMYSAYDGVHTFQIPAVVNGLDPTEIQIEWSASDPSMVNMQLDPSTGGVMITTQKAGNVTIYAQAGGLCGEAPLSITAATPAQWEQGNTRYNSGVIIDNLGQTRHMAEGGVDAECTSCHGDTASAGPFKTVQHTPEQTGGFSDADLISIFEKGIVPTGGYFDATIVPYATWQTFHHWDVGDAEQGLVVYLRSLVPAAQTGSANFGGMFSRPGRDGGMGGRPEGGVPPNRDAAVSQ
ncbi:MAG TPA: hypothetical protein VH560_03865 [Polyangia bacterium]|jgi:hypothetical protein|nr:hypothetical protein [Polyangia bacterium]